MPNTMTEKIAEHGREVRPIEEFSGEDATRVTAQMSDEWSSREIREVTSANSQDSLFHNYSGPIFLCTL